MCTRLVLLVFQFISPRHPTPQLSSFFVPFGPHVRTRLSIKFGQVYTMYTLSVPNAHVYPAGIRIKLRQFVVAVFDIKMRQPMQLDMKAFGLNGLTY